MRTASDRERKATTFRLDPQLHKGLVLLQGVLRRPLNRLVNEAVQGFIERRTAEVESELLEVLTRVRAYRRSDPKFENAISQFVAAEASLLEALRRAPKTCEIYESLAALALSAGDAPKALAYFQDLLTLAPHHALAARAVPVLRASLAAA